MELHRSDRLDAVEDGRLDHPGRSVGRKHLVGESAAKIRHSI